ncbi:hypothetical protein CA267_018110 [Alteromonas pelagimontana]|uniref:PEP-CTERM sorting domain-containing protein n=1 Tax=Alteromonas pelagimontana TaxID=1858656 RepID=A0A6M4MH39_9ALTE|nr:hypothetical protein [Alteromonas pelagimontana]QJR82531.1 hypothetical protein CA267_018110 [Alteromonas pelagimontana]
MKKTLLGSLITLAFCSASGTAAMIENGDFSTCDLTSWQTDSDGAAGNPADFTVTGAAPNCAANIYIDNTDAMANTLYQNLDLTASADSQLWLNYDFSVNSELTDQAPLTADYFAVYLNDGSGMTYDYTGNLGTFFGAPDINGEASYTGAFLLDDSFKNQTGWSIEFQLLSNVDMSPAWMTINSVSLNEVTADVSAPATFSIASLGLFLLGARRMNRSSKAGVA